MDVGNAKKVLLKLDSGKMKFKVVRTPMVSPFGLNLIMQGHADLIKVEDKIKFLKRIHQLHLKVIGEDI